LSTGKQGTGGKGGRVEALCRGLVAWRVNVDSAWMKQASTSTSADLVPYQVIVVDGNGQQTKRTLHQGRCLHFVDEVKERVLLHHTLLAVSRCAVETALRARRPRCLMEHLGLKASCSTSPLRTCVWRPQLHLAHRTSSQAKRSAISVIVGESQGMQGNLVGAGGWSGVTRFTEARRIKHACLVMCEDYVCRCALDMR
jgi:hypothetical protein